MLSEILYDESVDEIERVLKMEKWEKRDKKRDSKKRFNLFLRRNTERLN